MNRIDLDTVSRLFDSHAKALLLYARQWVDAARAEEVVQDAFLRLMSQRNGPDKTKAWLFAAVRNSAISEVRSNRRYRKHGQHMALQQPGWFQPRADELVDAAAAQQALASLPQEQREVIVLRIWGGMTLQEISGIAGQPVSTLFSRYKAGLAALKKRMESPCKNKD